MSDPQASSPRLACPGCGEEVEVSPESAGQLVRCSYCNTDFFASKEQSHLQVVDDTAPAQAEQDREIAFDKLRIEHFTALRMGAIRARSWWLIAMCMCALIVLDMLGKVIVEISVNHHWGLWPTLRVGLAIAAGFSAKHAYQRAAQFKKEIDKSAIPEPTTPPDFSTLDNGSDRWKDLENVR